MFNAATVKHTKILEKCKLSPCDPDESGTDSENTERFKQ